MLQREVAERVASPPGTRQYGALSILVQLDADVEPLLTLPPGAFRPAPKVWSAVIRLHFRPSTVVIGDRLRFESMVRSLFSQRRKMLANALQPAASSRGMERGGGAARGADRRLPGGPRRCILKSWLGLRTFSMPEIRPVWYSSPGNYWRDHACLSGSPSSLTGGDRTGAAAGFPIRRCEEVVRPRTSSSGCRPILIRVVVPDAGSGTQPHAVSSWPRRGRGVGSARAPMSVHQADPASNEPLLEVVPLGGLGEFGLNSMAVSYADTQIAVDAGSMFPEPELLGIDLIVPDFTYLFGRDAKTRAHRADARARGSHRRGAVRREAVRRAHLRHADDARPDRSQARGARHRRIRSPRGGPPPRSCRRGRPHAGVPAGHAQHAGLRGGGHPHAGRDRRAHGRLQDRPDAAGRGALRLPPLRRAGQRRRAGALLRQHQHRAAGLHGVGARRRAGVRGDLRQHARQDRRHVVRHERLPAADPGEHGGPVRAQSGLPRPRHGRVVAAGPAPRLPEGPRGPGDPRIGDQVPSARRRRLPRHGQPGRADVGAVAHRHQRPPPRHAGARRRRGVLGARDSRQRALDRPRRQPHRPARRRHHQRGDQARARVRPRQRRRAEAAAVARAAALLHPDPRVVPPAGPPRPHRRAPDPEPAEPRRGDRGRERRRARTSTATAAGSPTRCRPAAC